MLWQRPISAPRRAQCMLQGGCAVVIAGGYSEDIVHVFDAAGETVCVQSFETCALEWVALEPVVEDALEPTSASASPEASPLEALVLGASGGQPRRLDVRTGQWRERKRRASRRDPVEAFAIAPSGRRKALAAGGQIKITSIPEMPRRGKSIHGGPLMAFTPDDELLVWRREDPSTWGPTLSRWQLRSKVPRWIQQGPWPDPVVAVAALAEQVVVICEGPERSGLLTLRGHTGQIMERIALPEGGPWRLSAPPGGECIAVWAPAHPILVLSNL